MSEHLHWDPLLIQRYNKSGPRYTSYPTAVEFKPVAHDLEARLAFASRNMQKPVSLYLHIPFCRHVCYYCGCNKIVTKDTSKAASYLELLKQEITLKRALFKGNPIVEQLHLGGGTPTFLSDDELRNLMQFLHSQFTFSTQENVDFSIEIDPRELRQNTLKLLRELGFNRISFGVQDLEERVQIAVNRLQPEEMIRAVMHEARALEYRSINMDLIYGLPFQTLETFDRTLKTIIEMKPDRLSVFNYAHLPERFKPQRRINAADLPNAAEKLNILGYCINTLSDAGYHYIGMDHFALPTDVLAIAQASGKLHRNFQGYTTHGDCDLIGVGVSSISQIGNWYFQNVLTIDAYEQALNNKQLPIIKQLKTNEDDHLRRTIITELLCHLHINFNKLDSLFNIDSRTVLASSLEELNGMILDGLVEITADAIIITERGRLLARNVCMAFDTYLPKHTEPHFSKAI